MSDSSSNNNNQDTQSVEFIDKIGDHPTNSFTSPEVLTKNNYSEDNDAHHTIEDFSQSNNVDSRNESEKKVEIQSMQQDSSSEPQKIYREQSDDSQSQTENIQQGDVKSNEQQEDEEGFDEQKNLNEEIDNENLNDNQENQEQEHLLEDQNEQLNFDQQKLGHVQEHQDDQIAQNNQDEQEKEDEEQPEKQQLIDVAETNLEENQKQEEEHLLQQQQENEIEEEEERDEEIQQITEQENEKEQLIQNEEQGIDNQEIQQEGQQKEEIYKESEIQVQDVLEFQQELIKKQVEQQIIEQQQSQQPSQQGQQQQVQSNLQAGQQHQVKYNPEIEQYPESGVDGDTYSAQRQYEYMIEMQKKQVEFSRQMEELNQKYNINFRKIVDVKSESLSGNYMTGLLAIKMKYKFIDSKDQHGMTMLHNAVLGNEKELVLFLLNNGSDVNGSDACGRTPLMMAAHGGASQRPENDSNKIKKGFDEDTEEVRRILKLHSFNKIFKILVDRGACFATKDVFQFSALLYSVQNQNLLILFYLIYLGANLRDSDTNGSSVVHWNAYKGNRFLMEVFHTLNLDMFTADNQGFTPLSRSIMGVSYDTVDFLARLIKPEFLPNPDEMEADGITHKIPSLSIRHNLKEIKTGHTKWYNKLLAWWREKCSNSEENGIHPATFVFFVISGFLFYSAFKTIYSQRNYISGHSSNETWLYSFLFFFNIVFFISTFVYMSFSVRFANTMIGFKNRSKGVYVLDDDAIDRANQLKLEEERNIPPYMRGIMNDKTSFERIYQRMNFKHIDRLLEDAPQYKATQNQEEELNRTTITDHGDEESRVGLTQKNSYNHLTFIHQIAILFENNYFTSLGEVDFKRICGTCLKYKPEKTKHCDICKTCVPYYQFHSILFNTCISAENHLLYLIHIFSLWVSLFTYMMIQHIQFSPFLESWQIFKYFEVPYHLAVKVGFIHALVYFGVLIGLFYTTIYCSIELIGIFEDKTRDEILNPFDYSYNYEVITDKNRNLVKVLKVRTTGLIEYLKQTLKIVYYRTFLHLKQKK